MGQMGTALLLLAMCCPRGFGQSRLVQSPRLARGVASLALLVLYSAAAPSTCGTRLDGSAGEIRDAAPQQFSRWLELKKRVQERWRWRPESLAGTARLQTAEPASRTTRPFAAAALQLGLGRLFPASQAPAIRSSTMTSSAEVIRARDNDAISRVGAQRHRAEAELAGTIAERAAAAWHQQGRVERALAARKASRCDVSDGAWVADGSRPAYSISSCPILPALAGATNCFAKFDKSWMRWSWKPRNCGASLPRFSAQTFLRRMKNRVIAMVGDSLIYSDFFPSLLCQLHQVSRFTKGSDAGSKYGAEAWVNGPYNLTLLRYWSPFLASTNNKPSFVRKMYQSGLASGKTGVNPYIADTVWSSRLRLFDLIIFQSAVHWENPKMFEQPFFVDSKWRLVWPQGQNAQAYQVAMKTVASLFSNQTSPVPYFLSIPPKGPANCGSNGKLFSKAEAGLLKRSNLEASVWLPTQASLPIAQPPFKFIDITSMSLARGDAYVGSNNAKSRDCLHFCLPGLPDSWVDVFYHAWSSDAAFSAEL